MALEPIDEWIKRHEKEPEEVAKEKLDRMLKTLNLKAPDRVPILVPAGDFFCKYTGITWYDLSYEFDKIMPAVKKYFHDFPSDWAFVLAPYMLEGFILALAFADYPDFSNIIRFLTGPIHDVLRDRWTRWPGRELPPTYHPQFLGGEFMKPEEYKKFIENPIEFIHSTILPRAAPGLGLPGSLQWNGAWIRVGMVMQRTVEFLAQLFGELARLGYPLFPMTNAYAPADVIGDFLRHPTGAMLDMRRYPEEFKAAVEVLVEPIIKVATAIPPAPPVTLTFIPLHLNEMLPPKLYNEFYWPTLKSVIEALVSKGYKLFVIFEGDHTPHVETILELPKGWGIAWFERTQRAKNFIQVWETLKGHTIVMGGVPTSLFLASPEKMEEHVKSLLSQIKSEGGFILAPSIGEVSADTKPETMRTFINSALKYGVY